MSLESEIYDALAPLVSNRVHANTFPQEPKIPVAPAIRFVFISADQIEDICGTDGGRTANTRTQIDVIAKGFDQARALRQQVIDALEAIETPTRLTGGFDDFDADLKLHRCVLDFISYPSS